MPFKPEKVNRPWIKQTDYNSLQGQGRKNVNPFYQSSAWKRLRHTFKSGISYHLGSEPHPNTICIECKKEGRITPTHTIDHIKPINQVNAYDTQRGRYGEPLVWENLQPLCEHHAASKNAKERHQNQ